MYNLPSHLSLPIFVHGLGGDPAPIKPGSPLPKEGLNVSPTQGLNVSPLPKA